MDVICSTTDSWAVNRASHAVKVGLSTAAFAVAFHILKPSKMFLAGVGSFAALSFSAICLTYEVIARVKADHSPDPYNQVLNRIWGNPQSRQARLQVPFFTGLEVAIFATLISRSSGRQLALCALAIPSIAVRGVKLWGVLSEPPPENSLLIAEAVAEWNRPHQMCLCISEAQTTPASHRENLQVQIL